MGNRGLGSTSVLGSFDIGTISMLALQLPSP